MSLRWLVVCGGLVALALATNAQAQIPDARAQGLATPTQALLVIPAPGLVAFEAVGCGPCRRMQPILQRIEQAGARVTRVDVDRTRAAAAAFRVTRTPTYVAIDRQGREVGRIVGAVNETQLRALMERTRP